MGFLFLRPLAREVDGRWIENVYRLQLINTTEGGMDVAIAAESPGLPGLSVEYERGAGHLAPTSNRLLPLRLRVPLEQAASGTHVVDIVVSGSPAESGAGLAADRVQVRQSTRFFVPDQP